MSNLLVIIFRWTGECFGFSLSLFVNALCCRKGSFLIEFRSLSDMFESSKKKKKKKHEGLAVLKGKTHFRYTNSLKFRLSIFFRKSVIAR